MMVVIGRAGAHTARAALSQRRGLTVFKYLECSHHARWAAPALLGSVLFATTVAAGGFHSQYQSATAAGTAFAGASARADDASFFLYNPAVISALEGRQTYIDARAFAPSVEIASSRALSPLGAAVTGDSGNIARNALAAGSVTVVPIMRGLNFGIGSSAPFATDVETRSQWGGQYHLLRSYMVGLTVNGALSWQATPWLALAGGVQVQRMENRFENLAVVPLSGGSLVEAPAYLKGTGWAAGPIAGLVLTPTRDTRIGLAWKSGLTHRMDGTAGAPAAGVPVERLHYDLDLPPSISIGLEQRLSPSWRLFAEWSRVDWTRFKGFDISFASGRPDEHRPINWQATWLAGLGVGYQLTKRTEITSGLSYDTSASRDGSGSTLSPDANKILLGFGINHDAPGIGRLSFSYGHLWLRDAPVKASSAASGQLDGTLAGQMHTAGVGYTVKW